MSTVKAVSLRQKGFNMMLDGAETEPKHGHPMEYFIEVIGLVCSIMFVIGSYCFESPSAAGTGDIIFIIACLVNTLVSVLEFSEKIHHNCYTEVKERDEALEAALFMMSNVAFTVGCVFFLPSFAKFGLISSQIGAWLSIVGSFCLTFAVFFMGLGFGVAPGRSTLEPAAKTRCRQMGKLNICCLLIGAMFFTMGSFMYRPIFGGLCPQGSDNAVCEAVSAYGTKSYLYGSYLFTASSVLGIALAYDKHHSQIKADQPTETSKLMPGA